MKQSLIKKLCCPFDKEALELTVFSKDTEENILEGLLTCLHCKRYYPIAYGVPIMTPDEYRELPLETPLLQRWKGQLKGSHMENFRLLPHSSEERK
jgi:uncharacterized protein